MARDPDPVEIARRANAVIAYSGLTHEELAKATGITLGTIRNIVSTTRPSGGNPENRLRVALACGVPALFMEVGFAPLEREITDADQIVLQEVRRLAALAQRIPAIEERLGEVEGRVSEIGLEAAEAAVSAPATEPGTPADAQSPPRGRRATQLPR